MALSKVLCADSSGFTGKILSKKLRSMNFNVDYVSTGDDAIKLALVNSYEMIFMNLELPNLSGYNVAMEIREFDFHVPIIVYSSYSRDRIDMSSFTDYLQKPFRDEDLDSLISMYFKY